jgi:hypothetical protein
MTQARPGEDQDLALVPDLRLAVITDAAAAVLRDTAVAWAGADEPPPCARLGCQAPLPRLGGMQEQQGMEHQQPSQLLHVFHRQAPGNAAVTAAASAGDESLVTRLQAQAAQDVPVKLPLLHQGAEQLQRRWHWVHPPHGQMEARDLTLRCGADRR